MVIIVILEKTTICYSIVDKSLTLFRDRTEKKEIEQETILISNPMTTSNTEKVGEEETSVNYFDMCPLAKSISTHCDIC